MALLRARSHRARERLYRLAGESNVQEWFTFEDGDHFYEVDDVVVSDALTIPGVGRAAKPKGELRKPWAMS